MESTERIKYFILSCICTLILLSVQANAVAQEKTKKEDEQDIRVLIVGDQLLTGTKTYEKISFAQVVRKYVQEQEQSIEVVDMSRNGLSLSKPLELASEIIGHKADIILLALGTHDIEAGEAPSMIKQNYSRLVNRLQERAYGLILLLELSPPPESVSPFLKDNTMEYLNIKLQRGLYSSMFKSLTSNENTTLVKKAMEGVSGKNKIATYSDFYPNKKGYKRLLVNVWEPILEKIDQAKLRQKKYGKIRRDFMSIHLLGDSFFNENTINSIDKELLVYLNRLQEFSKENDQYFKKINIYNFSKWNNTTADGKREIMEMIKSNPDLVVIELGFNDIYKGIPVQTIYDNLSYILAVLQEVEIDALLVGIEAPAHVSPENKKLFAKMFAQLSQQYNVPLHPNITQKIAGNPKLVDSKTKIYPNHEGLKVMAKHLWPKLYMSVQAYMNAEKARLDKIAKPIPDPKAKRKRPRYPVAPTK